MASKLNLPKALALGAELRAVRQAEGCTLQTLGQKVGCSYSQLSRWERGKASVSVEDVAAILGALAVHGPRRDEILQLAREAADPNWVAPGVDRQFAALAEYERTATRIVSVEMALVPGLMQTHGYARDVLIEGGADPSEAEWRAQLRMGRQHVITSRPPKLVVAIVGEYALRYPPCSDGVMIEQLKHLVTLAEHDNVELRVVPIDRPMLAMIIGSWELIEVAQESHIVHLDHYSSASTITDARPVSRYRDAVDTLRDAALSPADSTRLIADVLRSKGETP